MGAALAALALAGLAGCSGGAGDAGAPQRRSTAGDDVRDLVLSPEEMAARVRRAASCARNKGILAKPSKDGQGLESEGVSPGSQAAKDLEACLDAEIGQRPEPTPEQKRKLYDLYVQQQRCIERTTGLTLETPPSKETWVRGGTKESLWTPEVAWSDARFAPGRLTGDYYAQLAKVLKACPRP